ncbi:MAG: hypothetical protein NC302_06805 [Bacteroidales bacterium]|nr:hypothetical protein [Bacteroidales bacterium]MCM1415409.1 hypothetical protein [bacterium]MCM1423342.1 hypothetical protein [bacterium]
MTTIDKRIEKFYRKPIPNDITFSDVEALAHYYGCEIKTGGNHSKKVVHRPSGTVIPIPIHDKCIGEAYVKELKDLFDSIKEDSNEIRIQGISNAG